ncbi:MAG: beta-glucuronidase [Bacteroidetes bacterium]|nr:beta-glucuronidase [Bacteroidota bacterium]
MKKLIVLTLVFTIGCIEMQAQNFKPADTKDIALFPQQNGLRNTMNLSGIWKFKVDSNGIGEKEQWYNGLSATLPIAVPGSWNEQYDDIRDYLGLAWYEQNTFIPKSWSGQKIYLRFGSANYAAKVWLNGKPLGIHEGGHLPFAFDITSMISWDAPNRITVQVENLLKPNRVPVGGLPPGGMFSNNPPSNFDFFPYCGLQRPVWLYTIPKNSISDITVKTTLQSTDGTVEIKIKKEGTAKQGKVKLEGDGKTWETAFTSSGNEATAIIKVPDAHVWNTDDPYLYQLTVTLTNGKEITDKYNLDIGIRTIAVDNKHILLNGKPIFLKGFGKHEDFPVFGKGTAYPVIVKDFGLLKWIGANSFRTSHYPYDEEYMKMADKAGILIIDEIPAVGLFFDNNLQGVTERKEMCQQQIRELITRDKNHPSVIMWSVANEPIANNANFNLTRKATADSVSMNFFKDLFKTVKENDDTRLANMVGLQGGPDEWLNLSDVICINRYYGWYTFNGNIGAGAQAFEKELDDLYAKFHKPILVTEFGADAYPGMHTDQPEMFTEEFQTALIKAYLDVAAKKDFVTGMHVWAFADFKTTQGVIRFGGMNWKGVFTRDRKPKAAAFYLRSRWAQQ